MMRAKVTEQGVLVPRELLDGVEEVEIWQEDSWVIVQPVAQHASTLDLDTSSFTTSATIEAIEKLKLEELERFEEHQQWLKRYANKVWALDDDSVEIIRRIRED